MKLNLFSSIEEALEEAIALSEASENLIPFAPDLTSGTDYPYNSLEEMSYYLKFKPGNYFSHLKPDPNRFHKPKYN